MNDVRGFHPPKAGDLSMLIGGELVASESGRWMESVNPANEELIGRVPMGSATDVVRAVDAAGEAQPAWAALSVAERAAYLKRLAEGLSRRADEILRIEVTDTGNTVYKMRDDVGHAIGQLQYYAGLGYEMKDLGQRRIRPLQGPALWRLQEQRHRPRGRSRRAALLYRGEGDPHPPLTGETEAKTNDDRLPPNAAGLRRKRHTMELKRLKSVGMVGLGKMGSPISRHLLRGGFEVTGFDVSPAALRSAEASGVHLAKTPAEVAARSEAVLVVVGFETEVERVIFGPKDVLDGARAGLMVAVSSTVAPAYMRDAADRAMGTEVVSWMRRCVGVSKRRKRESSWSFAAGARWVSRPAGPSSRPSRTPSTISARSAPAKSPRWSTT